MANITLKEDSELIDEVIVVGYGVQKKRDVTGAMASVDAAKIASVPVTSASEALQGRASGVLVSQDNWATGTTYSFNSWQNVQSMLDNEPFVRS